MATQAATAPKRGSDDGRCCCSSGPRSCCWGPSSSTRSSSRSAGASSMPAAVTSSASTTTRRCSRRDATRTAIKNNLIWVVFAPSIVTALGLMFAVLTERVAWSTAFKVAIFMPMAISFLSAGVTWRLIYEQDPDIGLANATVGAVRRRGPATGRVCRGRGPRRTSRTLEPTADGAVQAGRLGRRRATPRCSASWRSLPKRCPRTPCRPSSPRAPRRRHRRHRLAGLRAGRRRRAGSDRTQREGPPGGGRGGGLERRGRRLGHHRHRRDVRAWKASTATSELRLPARRTSANPSPGSTGSGRPW